jgi:hypothetical protein
MLENKGSDDDGSGIFCNWEVNTLPLRKPGLPWATHTNPGIPQLFPL